MKISALAAAAIFVAYSLPAASQSFFYPTQGQTPQQQQADQGQCHVWAVQHSGFDPSQAQAPQYRAPQQGGIIRDALARGQKAGMVGTIEFRPVKSKGDITGYTANLVVREKIPLEPVELKVAFTDGQLSLWEVT